MRWQLDRRATLAGLFAATLIMVLVGWESYRAASQIREAATARRQGHDVLMAIADIGISLVDAETGQRGYLLTGDQTYLEPYRKASRNLDHVISQLKTLISDDPDQQKRLQTLAPFIENKMAELQKTIDLRDHEGFSAANERVLAGQGKMWMDHIRASLTEMSDEENGLRTLRTQEMTAALNKGARTVVIGNFLSILLLWTVFAFLLRNLSQRKRAQQALAKSEKWSSTTLSSVGDAVIATDMNGAVTFMNSVAESLTGWTRAEAAGKSMDLVFDIVNRETRRPVENPIKKVFREGNVVGLADHTILRSKSGKELDIEDSAAPIVTDAKEMFGVVLVFRDITEKKQTAEQSERQKELLQLILDSVADGVVVADSNGKFLLFNAAAEQVLGVGAIDAAPSKWSDQYGTYLPDKVTQYSPNDLPLVRAMRGENVDKAEVFIRNAKVPEGRLLSITGRPLRGEQGALLGGVVVLNDITERKKVEEALRLAKDEAERGSKFKDQFLSTMSHELRTPLNAVLGFSDLLEDERYGPLTDRQRRYIGHIHTGGKHLLSLISDILDLSKIEAGRLELAIESLRVDALFGEILSVMRPLADRKSQRLTANAEPDLALRADATRLRQVLMNLLGNSIKFTPEGGNLELLARAENGRVRIEVRDSGPGIPLEEQKRIFEAFYRLRESGKKAEGTGLGLAITNRLVELHGGKLCLDSKVGHGSCFYFALPAAVGAREPLARKADTVAKPAGPPRILVVEDDRAAAQLIESLLMSVGYEVIICDAPGNALEVAAELQPSAITLDIVMKPKNGWEVLTQLKRDSRTSRIPMIVVSIVDQPAMGALLGADEYLIKPVDRTLLLAAIERCIGGEPAATKRPILVVEDDTPTREFIAEMLTTRGYAVVTAADGAQARAHVAVSLPELVILDLVLPKVGGLELLGEWRGDSRTAYLPVFVLTSKDLTPAETTYLRTHAESLLHKHEPWQDALVQQLQRITSPARESSRRV